MKPKLSGAAARIFNSLSPAAASYIESAFAAPWERTLAEDLRAAERNASTFREFCVRGTDSLKSRGHMNEYASAVIAEVRNNGVTI